jgi:vitamin B12 transporter
MTPCRRALVLLGILPLVALVPPARAAEDEAFLRLYFSDDELVESATRHPKRPQQIAENVTVVTAAEIRDMNAHTVAEVLNRVTGVFVQPFGVRFGATALPHIQGSGETQFFTRGSDERHVTILLDGIPWNNLAGGTVLDTIPVGAVERIEVIKGPASSAWGSALGGVINVITKRPGTSARPAVAVEGSYGERDAHDARAEAAGKVGPLGYYAQGQSQGADWKGGGGFESRSAIGKAEARLGGRAMLSLAGGYSGPEVDAGRIESSFARAQDRYRATYGRAGLDLGLAPALTFHAASFLRRTRHEQTSQEDGTFAPAGDLLRDVTFDERHAGAQGRLVWATGRHTLVLGIDYHRGWLDQTVDSGDFFQSLGAPSLAEFSSTIDLVGVYLNDTVTVGAVALTPGVRYDDTSRTDPFWSPSLGATWQVARDTLLRASVARGFTTPPLSFLSGGGISLDPNPDLEPERVWSYQAGAETAAVPALWLRIVAFRHEVRDVLETVTSPVTEGNDIPVNRGRGRRTGFEAEAETARYGGFALRAGFAYVHVDKDGRERDQDQHHANLVLSYADGPWKANLLGHYVWWDLGPGAREGSHDDWLWDVVGSRSFALFGRAGAELFAAVRNLFNGDQMVDTDRGTEPRWVEGGMRLRF